MQAEIFRGTTKGTRMRRATLLLVGMAAWTACSADGVFISGQKFSLEEAVEQALNENRSRANERFWVIVSGSEVARVTKTGAGQEIAERIREVRERGGVVYVCQSDLEQHAISEDELLDGVERVAGFESPSPGLPAASEENGLPQSVPQSRLILRACAGDDEPPP